MPKNNEDNYLHGIPNNVLPFYIKRQHNNIDDAGGAFTDLEKYIDRLDQDRRDMERRIRDDQQTMEQRLTQDRRDAEQRTKALEERLEQRFSGIDQRFDRMEQKLELLSSDVYKEGKSTRNWIASMSIATIIGIAAMVIAIFLK